MSAVCLLHGQHGAVGGTGCHSERRREYLIYFICLCIAVIRKHTFSPWESKEKEDSAPCPRHPDADYGQRPQQGRWSPGPAQSLRPPGECGSQCEDTKLHGGTQPSPALSRPFTRRASRAYRICLQKCFKILYPKYEKMSKKTQNYFSDLLVE